MSGPAYKHDPNQAIFFFAISDIFIVKNRILISFGHNLTHKTKPKSRLAKLFVSQT